MSTDYIDMNYENISLQYRDSKGQWKKIPLRVAKLSTQADSFYHLKTVPVKVGEKTYQALITEQDGHSVIEVLPNK